MNLLATIRYTGSKIPHATTTTATATTTTAGAGVQPTFEVL